MAPTKRQAEQAVTIRRSPRLSAFVVVFGLIGFLGTLILTGLYEADPSIGFGTLFAYFSLYGITGSIALGIVVWLILDLRSRRQEVRTVMARDESTED